MIDMKNVGKTIAALRNRKGMTQQQLAAATGVTHQAVSRWENGASLPDMQTMLSLSRLFGVTIEQILNGEALEEKPNLAKKFLSMLGLDQPVEKPDEAPEADIEDEPDAEETAPEAEKAEPADGPAAEEAQPKAETQAEPEQKPVFNLKRVISVAPFMSKEALDELVMKCMGYADWHAVVALAPFLSRAALAKIVDRLMQEQDADRAVIVKLAPFIGSDQLAQLLEKNSSQLNWTTLKQLAPFLPKDVVDRLAVTLAQMPDDAEPDKTASTIESVLDNVGSVLDGIGNGITNAVQNVVKTINQYANGTQSEKAEPEKPKSEKKAAVLRIIAKKAIEDENADWLSDHIDDIDDAETLAKAVAVAVHKDDKDLFESILERAEAIGADAHTVGKAASDAGKTGWLTGDLGRFTDTAFLRKLAEDALARNDKDLFVDILEQIGENGGDVNEAAHLASDAGKADWLGDVLESITDSAILLRFARTAVENRDMELLRNALSNLDDAGKTSLCDDAEAAADTDAMSVLLEYGCADRVLIYAVKRSLLDLTDDAAECAGDDALTEALQIAIEKSDWPVINIITEYMN